MLERQGHSQSEIESKVASFRALLLRQITSSQSVNNNSKSSPGRPEPDSTTPVQETTKPTKERSLSRHREEKEQVRQHKKRKRKKEESKPRKKKKKEKRKVHYCSSPSYSDFEPEDPILRRRLRERKKGQQKVLPENVVQDKAWAHTKKEKRKKKRRHRSRSESKNRSKSSSRSRSRSKLRKSRDGPLRDKRRREGEREGRGAG